MAALVRLLLLLVLAPAAWLLAGPAMLPAAAGRPGPKLLVEVAAGDGARDAPVVVGERDPVPVKQTGGYTLSRAPRLPPSGPSPIHNDVGPAGFVVRRITAQITADGAGLEVSRVPVEGNGARTETAAADHKDHGLPSSQSQIPSNLDRQQQDARNSI